MATDGGKASGTAVPGGEATLAGGSYEVIRARLHSQADALATRANDLNARRKALFGGTELTVIGNERVRTENNCVPRDIVSVGKYLLFGYNVFIGLKKETVVSDVFSLHRFEKTAEGFDLSAVPPTEAGGFLADPRFVKDFGELYKYYKDAKLLQLRRRDSRLLAVFQTGQSARDLKVFRFNVDVEGRATYVDNQGERDHVYPPSHDFEWTVATREQYVLGQHPHVNVLDQVFVETVKGDLTIKVEDNTSSGMGIYSEPVDDPDQSLDDAEFAWTQVGGLIVLRVLPFREKAHRYLVFNARTQHVVRIDAIGQSCVRLPEDQGIVFPGGYYLQTGDYKVFDGASDGMEFHQAVRSPNGEDVLYVFHRRDEGNYVLFPYNLVRKEVQTPLVSNGMSLFADGGLVVFRATSQEPTRVHPMQVWQTPFVSDEHAAQLPPAPGYLGKVGNAELVRGISDALTLPRVAKTDKPTRRTYEDLVSAATRALDAYYWLGNAEVGLQEPIELLRRTSELIIDEFEKVLAMRKRAEESLAQATQAQDTLLLQAQPEGLTDAEGFMRALADLRRHRGHLITLKDVRYMDLGRLDALEQAVVAASDAVSSACVDFLQKGEALQPLATRLDGLLTRLEPVTTTAELAPLAEDVERTGQGLEVLGDVVGGLQVGDPLARARILEGISELFSRLNRVRAGLQARRKELSSREKRAEFGAQFKLLGQSIENALSQADSPEKCDEGLSRLTVMLEELEGRFGEFDEFLGQITVKREELLEAFGARKQSLVDERQRRASGLFSAAERILQGVQRRAKSFKADDELNAYFASDAMILKLRQLAEQLLALQDSVRADEVVSRVKSAKQDALRALRDRQDLFEGGEGLIKLGPYRFHVNTQPLDLTLVPRDGALYLQLTGSDYTQKLEDPELLKYRELWDQHLVSETRDVYRAEYLAAGLLMDAEEGKAGLSLAELYEAGAQGHLLERVRAFSAKTTTVSESWRMKATSAACTTRTRRPSWRSCSRSTRARACCASPRCRAPGPRSTGRLIRTSRCAACSTGARGASRGCVRRSTRRRTWWRWETSWADGCSRSSRAMGSRRRPRRAGRRAATSWRSWRWSTRASPPAARPWRCRRPSFRTWTGTAHAPRSTRTCGAWRRTCPSACGLPGRGWMRSSRSARAARARRPTSRWRRRWCSSPSASWTARRRAPSPPRRPRASWAATRACTSASWRCGWMSSSPVWASSARCACPRTRPTARTCATCWTRSGASCGWKS